ncbi:hypothetical protein P3342_009961 [Pyrenophora teres f. teres]|uniref:Uncharacterized protein n=2 Tax=Pyrenophora teres f. teres TaxID=97479 RepID=E3RRC6_PYRTT|nr:hypothetical protein PTT_11349 [Pyrenophora teres f. teres 0-1]KAE8834468.1 hypothetical protein PTNB85_05801 [Pyrenophora teres f. teres]KAE8844051.1 hypothetical protein HRS9122_05154 [Pyrenophora teres f. teres]KAE8858892.1 hypothetical protein PTNB73_08372 [Pyrenophora teres f. teres]KAE8860755.1 hypothetical protein PTNB29_05850 [Pyrenophora teres f. teres]
MAIWTPPLHREATPLELYIGNTLNELAGFFYNVFHGTTFEYWLLDPKGQQNFIVITSALFLILWLVYIQYSIRSMLAPSNASRTSSFSPMKGPETLLYKPLLPTMRQLAPPGHRPTNANLNIPPFYVAQPLGPRTGRPTSPGYQTPFKENSVQAKGFSTRPSVPNFKFNFNHEDFPALATGRMATYRRLHGSNGMLHPAATKDEGRVLE